MNLNPIRASGGDPECAQMHCSLSDVNGQEGEGGWGSVLLTAQGQRHRGWGHIAGSLNHTQVCVVKSGKGSTYYFVCLLHHLPLHSQDLCLLLG